MRTLGRKQGGRVNANASPNPQMGSWKSYRRRYGRGFVDGTRCVSTARRYTSLRGMTRRAATITLEPLSPLMMHGRRHMSMTSGCMVMLMESTGGRSIPRDSPMSAVAGHMGMRSARLVGMRRIRLPGRGEGLDLGLHVDVEKGMRRRRLA